MTVSSVFVHYSTPRRSVADPGRMNGMFVCMKVAFFAAHYLTRAEEAPISDPAAPLCLWQSSGRV